MFIGREEELKEIKESLAKHSFQSTVIYGRKRMGKTTLMKQGLVSCPLRILSFEFQKAALFTNLSLFQSVIRDFFHNPYLSFDSFDSTFDFLLEKSTEEEYVLVLDEFSFLLTEDPEIESSLAVAIDKHKRKSLIHLFVLGSHVSLMKSMISINSHCYGRFNHILPLRAFDYYDSARFYPNYSDEDKIMLYSVFGGVPYFNSLIDTDKSALDNIISLIVKADSLCEHEIEEIILAETNKTPLLNSLFLLILQGKEKYKDINAVFSSANLTRPDYHLQTLLDMDLIEKRYSIHQESNKKRMRYAIKDNLLSFYFRYLFAAKNKELRKNPEFYFENFIAEDFYTKYIPEKFEEISRQFLIRMNLSNRIHPPFFEIGEYSYNTSKTKTNRQFDVVTKDKTGYIAYECKYKNEPIGNNVIAEEENQTKNLPDITFYKLGFISKNGFKSDVDKEKHSLFTLSDFYK